ncbi:glycosyltransferase [Vibrio sp. 10N.286.49.F3]|uniref:glycosyltransferase n=1 Tax=Vibrio sp. 10N.286.49.F3 TaxID=3229704 RepID=UPI0035521600
MKILQVNKFYSPDIGGIETVCKQHSEYLNNYHEVTVLCCNKKRSKSTETSFINGVKVIRTSSWGTFWSMPISFSFIVNFFLLYRASDLIFIHYPFPLAKIAFIFSKLITFNKNKKVIVLWHSDIVKQKKVYTLLKPLTRVLLRNSDLVLTTSPNMIEHSPMLKLFEFKCSVLPLSVNVSNVLDLVNNIKSNNSKLSDYYDLIFFGRLCYYKGIDVFLDALIVLARKGFFPKVLIAGQGELSELVKNKIESNNLNNIHFINEFLSENEKYCAIHRSKVFVFPSVAVSEAFGITQLEAMALRKPVINTKLLTGVPWVSLHDISGRTVKPNDSHALALEVYSLLNNNDKIIELGSRGYTRVCENFDDIIVFNKLDNYIESLTKSSST